MWGIAYQRRKARQNVSAFKALITTPGTGAIAMPANCRLAFKTAAGASAGTAVATISGSGKTRNIQCPVLAAGETIVIDNVEKDFIVTAAAGFDVMLDTGFSNFIKIGGP